MMCDRVRPYLSRYAAGEVASATELWVRAHLSTCLQCETDAGSLGTAVALLRRLPLDSVDPPSDLSAAVMERIQRDRSRRLVALPLVPASELARVSGDVARVIVDNRETIIAAASTAAAVAGTAWLAWRATKGLRAGPATA